VSGRARLAILRYKAEGDGIKLSMRNFHQTRRHSSAKEGSSHERSVLAVRFATTVPLALVMASVVGIRARMIVASLRLVAWFLLALTVSIQPAGASELLPLGRFHEYVYYTDVWGYAAPDGTELAIIGTSTGFSFIDVTNPREPRERAFIPSGTTAASDIKTYGNHAFLVNDQARTVQVVSLADPRHPVEIGAPLRIAGCHNSYIDVETGMLYSVRPGQDLQVLDVRDPTHLVQVGSYPYRFHDLHVRDGRAYGLDPEGHSLVILDVSRLPEVSLVERVPFLVWYAHSGWLTEDGRYFFATDESAGGSIHVFDLEGPEVVEVASWKDPTEPDAILHNVHIQGDIAYVSWYTSGVYALDVRDPAKPAQLSRYDTFAGSNPGLTGCFGVYPHLPSGNILASDMSNGLWIFEPRLSEADITLVFEEAGTGKPISGASVYFPFLSEAYPSDQLGRFPLTLPQGIYPFRVSHPDYFPIEGEVEARWLEVSTRTFPMRAQPEGGVLPEPSPTYGPTQLRFQAPEGTAAVEIYDAAGRSVERFTTESGPAGVRVASWDGMGPDGRLVPAGIYFVRIDFGETSRRGRIHVIR
jgi:choice-of-anchor B domain-containing protein